MLKLMLWLLLQSPNPLQLFEADELSENVVVLVRCAYAIGTAARIVATIGTILFIIPVSYNLPIILVQKIY
jgi:hypothetical protein